MSTGILCTLVHQARWTSRRFVSRSFICLGRCQYQFVVSVLFQMPAKQGSIPFQKSSWADPGLWEKIFKYSRRFGWTSSSILRVYFDFYHHYYSIQMVRTNPSPVYNSRRMCKGSTMYLDPNLWSFSSNHLWQRSKIHKLHLEFSLQVPWKNTFSNHILPSSIQWSGREVLSSAQGVSESSFVWNRLVSSSFSGFSWSPQCSQRGFCYVGLWSSFWFSIGP